MIQSITMAKTLLNLKHKKEKKQKKLVTKMENLRNRIDIRIVSNKKGYLKMDMKTKLYVSKNI